MPPAIPARPLLPRLWPLVGALVLAGALGAAYQNTWGGPFLLDDASSIAENPTIRSLRTAWCPPTGSGLTVSGRPLLNFSLALNYACGGTQAGGYHLGNLLLHALAGLTLWGVLRRTFAQPVLAARFGARAAPLAWLAAAAWVLHPLQTESVTYVIQRAESLAGLCALFTLYAFIRSLETPARGWTVACGLACLAGMAAKETMAPVPLLVLLYDRTFVSGSFRESWRRHRALLLGLAATWLLLGALVVAGGGRGDTVGFRHVAWWQYALTQTTAIVRYLRLALWPAGQVFDYGQVIETNPVVWLPCALLVAGLATAAVVALRRAPAAGFLGAWFFALLAPTSSIIPVATQTIAEHRMYLPLAAVVVGLAVLLDRGAARLGWGLLAALVVAAGFTTARRNATYTSELTLWQDTADKMPENYRALNNLGLAWLNAEQPARAAAVLQSAIPVSPGYVGTYNNLAVALSRLGRCPEALAVTATAIRLAPEIALVHATEGAVLLQMNRPEQAIVSYERAVALATDPALYQGALANALARAGRDAEAGAQFTRALQLDPANAATHADFAALLVRAGRLPEANAQAETAVRLQPGLAEAHNHLGLALSAAGRLDPAIAHFREAARLRPTLFESRRNLANALAEAGRPDEALPVFRELLAAAPPSSALQTDFGTLCGRLQRFDEARRAFATALQLDPQNAAARQSLDYLDAAHRKD